MSNHINVIGAGLAAQKPRTKLPNAVFPSFTKCVGLSQHHNIKQVILQNSYVPLLTCDSITNAVGLLKEEMRQLDSLIISSAEKHVPAGGALAVDREGFAES